MILQRPADFVRMFQSVTVLWIPLVPATCDCYTQLCDWWCSSGSILHCWSDFTVRSLSSLLQ